MFCNGMRSRIFPLLRRSYLRFKVSARIGVPLVPNTCPQPGTQSWRNKSTSCFKRGFASSSNTYRELDDEYYMRERDPGSGTFLLGITKNKLKDLEKIVWIVFTEERILKRGDYLFSLEDSKTLYDFYTPVDCTIQEINPKYTDGPSQESMDDLFESPGKSDNYLVTIKLNAPT